MRRNTQNTEEANERIEELFEEALKSFKNHPERSHRYVQIALRICAKTSAKIPKKFRSSYCRKCKKYLSSGINSKVRTRKGKIVVTCFNCGNYRRIMLKSKKTK